MKEFDSALQLCGFERVSIMINMLCDTLGSATLDENGKVEYDKEDIHPCLYDEKCIKLLATAVESLTELYQHMGEWGFGVDSEKWDNREFGGSEEHAEVVPDDQMVALSKLVEYCDKDIEFGRVKTARDLLAERRDEQKDENSEKN